jgi:hypothetical protein
MGKMVMYAVRGEAIALQNVLKSVNVPLRKFPIGIRIGIKKFLQEFL